MFKGCFWFLIFIAVNSALFTCAGAAYAQADSTQKKISATLTSYFRHFPSETIYLHSDKQDYLAGETIWYKTYATSYGQPSHLSHIVYVRLSDLQGKTVVQQKRPLDNGLAFGNLVTPAALADGWYVLRAFSAWELNFDKAEVFKKYIHIHKDEDGNNAGTNAGRKYHVDFFPEGGNLIDGAICNVAFRAADQYGLPVKVSGELLSGDNAPLLKFSSNNDGLGCFELEADAHAHYKAIAQFPDGSTQNVTLLGVASSGINLRVNPLFTDEMDLKIYNGGPGGKNVVIEALQNNGLHAEYPATISRGINVIGINASDFSTGIMQLIVFDDTGAPLTKRLIFIHHESLPDITIRRDSTSAGTDDNAYSMHLTGEQSKPIHASVSVSVIDATEKQNEETIVPYFLLPADIAAGLNDPDHYFKNNSDSLKQQLDLALLTGVSRQFGWDQFSHSPMQPLPYSPERAQILAGQIKPYQPSDGAPLKLMMSTPGAGSTFLMVKPDSAGIFKVDEPELEGSVDVSVMLPHQNKGQGQPTVNFFSSKADTAGFPADTSGFSGKAYSISTSAAHSASPPVAGRPATVYLKNAVKRRGERDSLVQKLIAKYVKKLEASTAESLDLADLPETPPGNIIDYINGRFPGLKILPQASEDILFQYNGAADLQALTPATGGPGAFKPYFYIDEQMADLGTVQSVPLNDVALIQFVPPPVAFAPLNGGFVGALLVYTKSGAGQEAPNQKAGKSADRIHYLFNGFSPTREFTTPATAGTTMFWAPDLNTDASGNINFHFKKAGKKPVRIVVQGMTDSGMPVYLEKVVSP